MITSVEASRLNLLQEYGLSVAGKLIAGPFLFILLLICQFEPTRADAPQAAKLFGNPIVMHLTSEQRTIFALKFGLDLTHSDVGELLGLSVDTVASEIKNARDTIATLRAQQLNRSKESLDTTDRMIAETLVIRSIASQIIDGLQRTNVSGDVSLTSILNSAAGKNVRVTGLSKDVNIVRPLLAILPAGALAPGQTLGVPAPFVLKSEAGVQPMAVTAAVLLGTLAGGRSAWLLKAYCLDKGAHAPGTRNTYTFDAENENLLTPDVRKALAGDGDIQTTIWETQESLKP